ncbi:hypothetical protein LA080_015310 [Diaporthe eres]|nr:hypothetical protein LA080_015310 [Diaporthe eres]
MGAGGVWEGGCLGLGAGTLEWSSASVVAIDGKVVDSSSKFGQKWKSVDESPNDAVIRIDVMIPFIVSEIAITPVFDIKCRVNEMNGRFPTPVFYPPHPPSSELKVLLKSFISHG